MRNVIRFETNIPVEATLEFDEGRVTEGRYGDQMFYSFKGNQCAYLEMDAAAQITALGAKADDTITICKREKKDGRKRSIAWDIQMVRAANRNWESNTAGAPLSTVAAPTAVPAMQQASQAQPQHIPATGGGDGLLAYRMALSAAIVIAQEGEQFAQSRGYLLKFTGEDVRTIAATLFIQADKSTMGREQFFGADANTGKVVRQ